MHVEAMNWSGMARAKSKGTLPLDLPLWLNQNEKFLRYEPVSAQVRISPSAPCEINCLASNLRRIASGKSDLGRDWEGRPGFPARLAIVACTVLAVMWPPRCSRRPDTRIANSTWITGCRAGDRRFAQFGTRIEAADQRRGDLAPPQVVVAWIQRCRMLLRARHKGDFGMGMNLDGPIYLQRNGMLTRERNRVLDIGPQTIYFARDEQIREFVKNQADPTAPKEGLDKEIGRLVHFSTPRPGERTTMLSEITDLTNIEYDSIDVCPGLKNTEILDLNYDTLPERMRGSYDVVFNFGTTEHIFNQWNCFEVIHNALKVGGVAYHQLPASGYLDHGYYCYTPLFFRELAQANGYKIERLAVTPAGESRIDALGLPSFAGDTLLNQEKHLDENNRIPALNIHAILRKTKDEPFRVALEIATAHSSASQAILRRYDPSYAATVWRVARSVRRKFF